MRVVWSVTQVSSFGVAASAGVFASPAFASAGLASLLGSCAEVGREFSPKNKNPNMHMVNSFFISAPVDCGGPNYRRRILRSMGTASQTWRGGGTRVLGRYEGSREKAARKEVGRGASFFPGPYGPG